MSWRRGGGRTLTQVDRPSGLTALQERFCQEYLVDLDGSAAYLRASGKPVKGAKQLASAMLARPGVQARVSGLMKERSARTAITADRVLEELAIVGYSDITQYCVGSDGRVSLRDGVPASALRALSKLRIRRREIPQKSGESVVETETEIWLWDKNAALTNLGRHLGLFADKVQHEAGESLASILARSWTVPHNERDNR